MVHEEFCWNSSDGLRLYGQFWKPEDNIKAVVCLVHGLGEHSSRYKVLPVCLAHAGYAFIAFDQRGHGKSDGKRGHTPSYEHLMDDITAFLLEAEKRFPGKPIFLYGHSMGGNLVLNYALRYKPVLQGVIVTGPWLKLKNPPGPVKFTFAGIMDLLWPEYTSRNGLKSSDLSHVEDMNPEKDEYIHPWITARTFMGVHKAGEYAMKNASEFSYPLLLMHGGSDNVTHPEASRVFASCIDGNCTLKIWDDLYHEIHNEPRNNEIFAMMTGWLDSHLPVSG